MLNKLSASHSDKIRWFLVGVGALVILIGAVNLFSTAFNYVGGPNAAQTAFAPLGSLGSQEPAKNPSIGSGEPRRGSSAASANLSALFNISLVATTTPITPVRLKIPAIGVSANVQQVGQKADGSMATPSNFQDVGWYTLGPKPGAAGNAVIAGHVNNALTMGGVFEHLSDVKVGDYVTVTDASGKTLIYVVTQTAQYTTDSAPASDIFSQNGPSQLVLITCDGAWDAAAHSYNKRLVVYAQLTNK